MKKRRSFTIQYTLYLMEDLKGYCRARRGQDKLARVTNLNYSKVAQSAHYPSHTVSPYLPSEGLRPVRNVQGCSSESIFIFYSIAFTIF